MHAAPLTEGDVDRGQVPDLRWLRAVVALAPHLRGSDPMRDAFVDWVSSHFDEDAAALFVTHLKRARELRAEGGLSDAHTMTSWRCSKPAPRYITATAEGCAQPRRAARGCIHCITRRWRWSRPGVNPPSLRETAVPRQ